MLFKNGIDLSSELIRFVDQSDSLFIFCPYIKLASLKELLASKPPVKAVIVRWETKDLILGVSDLEIYPYLRDKDITLYRNPRLHLKAYVDSYKRCFLTTANISSRALNLPNHSAYNYELGTIVDNLDLEDRLYFSIIENESLLITENIYRQFKQQLPEKKREFPDEADFSIKIEAPDKDFLISSLPMSYSVEALCRFYEERTYANEIELNCALHDLALYHIPLGLEGKTFRENLKSSFFNHPFIREFLNYLHQKQELYFGMVKEWIHQHCADVPTPRKWEITENIQILYRLITELGEGKYIIDRPNYSERLSIVAK